MTCIYLFLQPILYLLIYYFSEQNGNTILSGWGFTWTPGLNISKILATPLVGSNLGWCFIASPFYTVLFQRKKLSFSLYAVNVKMY